MSEPLLKCENNERHFQANLNSKTVSCFQNGRFLLLQLRGNLDFLEFLRKKFYNIDYW